MSKEVDDDDESAACAPHPKTLMLIRHLMYRSEKSYMPRLFNKKKVVTTTFSYGLALVSYISPIRVIVPTQIKDR
ncbi:hypothetical protein ACT8ZR_03615 [Neobacillus sp. M.A.Huq-85]|nr:hypothetical protein QNK12_13345 [Neobacillus cucumis]